MSGVVIAQAPGDGIGPEIMSAATELFRAAGVMEHVDFVPVEMGKGVFDKGDSRGMTDAAIRSVEETGVLFKGPMETPKGGGGKSINVTLRKLFNTYANFRHFRSLPGVPTVYSRAGITLNFSIVRENIEDTYGGIERRLSADVVEGKRLISAPGSDQVHRYAFEMARRLGVTRVHCGHKANIMKMTDGLFLERFRTVAKDFPGIETADVIVDALCMNMVLKPLQYQMVVLPNLQGDIVSDLAAGLVGGLGFAPSANIGRHISIFEAVHGTAPDIAGKGLANPTSLILSGIMMLRHIGLLKQAAVIENALLAALEAGVHTGDFGDPSMPGYKGPVGTAEFTRGIMDRLGQAPKGVPSVPVPEQSTPTWTKPVRPGQQQVVRTFTNIKTQVAGCDLYLDTDLSPTALAGAMSQVAEGSPFRLTLISNRGTQVWPTGSVYTECVDYFRVRFELAQGGMVEGQAEAIALMNKVATRFTVSNYELLRNFDGVRGYSLAQGQ
jgi:isocitrate dehydrogenase